MSDGSQLPDWEAAESTFRRIEEAFDLVEQAYFNQPKGGGMKWPEEERVVLFEGWLRRFWATVHCESPVAGVSVETLKEIATGFEAVALLAHVITQYD